jgi:hypothetical protein
VFADWIQANWPTKSHEHFDFTFPGTDFVRDAAPLLAAAPPLPPAE